MGQWASARLKKSSVPPFYAGDPACQTAATDRGKIPPTPVEDKAVCCRHGPPKEGKKHEHVQLITGRKALAELAGRSCGKCLDQSGSSGTVQTDEKIPSSHCRKQLTKLPVLRKISHQNWQQENSSRGHEQYQYHGSGAIPQLPQACAWETVYGRI